MASESQPTLGQIAQNLFETALQNILHETILAQHREHKLMIANLDSATKLPHCGRCKLPRLLEPPLAPKVRGATSDPPKDTQYCDRKPWSRRPGYDIYDNPFLKADSTGRPPTKKEREAAAKNKKNAADGGDGTPVSEEQNQNGTGPPSPSENGEQGSNDPGRKLEKGEKKASKIDEKLKKGEYIPWHTCPSCKRSLLITRFAKHLEQCMGLSGRQASRNAMAKMSSTPSASRAGTPQPANSQDGGGGKGEDDDEDDIAVKGSVSAAAAGGGGGNMKKKLLKKGLNQKIKKERNSSTPNNSHSSSGGKLSKPSGTGKKPGGAAANKASSPGNGPGAGGGSSGEKRDRDEMSRDDNDDDGAGEDDDEESVVHVKKRQKLERVGSTASLGSQSTAAGGGGLAGLEREESRDGSFVDEGSVGED
ncbi:hypothetical protein KC345_g4525 [Hortaea werneckii]|nr:hypothetical protein KC345_g4525 [Hortaea werneckii]